jgi:hypothetical protein
VCWEVVLLSIGLIAVKNQRRQPMPNKSLEVFIPFCLDEKTRNIKLKSPDFGSSWAQVRTRKGLDQALKTISHYLINVVETRVGDVLVLEANLAYVHKEKLDEQGRMVSYTESYEDMLVKPPREEICRYKVVTILASDASV